MTNAEKLSRCIWVLENEELTGCLLEEVVDLLVELRRDEWKREAAVDDDV